MKTDQPQKTLISIQNLKKRFGGNTVLDDFNLTLDEGENLVIMGKSGSGKSVMIKCLIGLEEPDSGTITVMGKNINQLEHWELDELRTEIGFLFQGSALYDSMSVRENLEFRDGFFANDEKHQLEIIKMIRKYQPEIVLCNAIADRHIDHGKGSKLVSDACFLSGLTKIETEFNGEKQTHYRPKLVYHYIQWQSIAPDFVVDVSGFMDVKMKAVQAYASQFYDPNSMEPVTPIASKNFLESIQYRAQDLGRLVGVTYAEGFTTERYVTVNSIGDLK